jgi:hypothetical protein
VLQTGNLVATGDGDHILITNRSGEEMTGGTGRDVFTLGNNGATDNNPGGTAPTITNYDANDAIHFPFLGTDVTEDSIETYVRLVAGDEGGLDIEVDIDGGGFDDPYVAGHISNLPYGSGDIAVIWQQHETTLYYNIFMT